MNHPIVGRVRSPTQLGHRCIGLILTNTCSYHVSCFLNFKPMSEWAQAKKVGLTESQEDQTISQYHFLTQTYHLSFINVIFCLSQCHILKKLYRKRNTSCQMLMLEPFEVKYKGNQWNNYPKRLLKTSWFNLQNLLSMQTVFLSNKRYCQHNRYIHFRFYHQGKFRF